MDNTLFYLLLCGYMVLFICGIILYAMIQDTFKYAKLAHERIDLVWQCLDLFDKQLDKQADKDDDKHGGTDARQQPSIRQ